jgi:hypothetical protein
VLLLVVGNLSDIILAFGIEPSAFQETICRNSFMDRRLQGSASGIAAQRALLTGGTLQNGKVKVEQRISHGMVIRELIAGIRFEPGADVTCYGGFVEKRPPETEEHTHMRGIPASDYALNGILFSGCFPIKPGAALKIGHSVALTPQCEDQRWEAVIASSGIGYFANTVTRCPLSTSRPNVVVHALPMYRKIAGVSYSSVLVLRAASHGIDVGEPIISPYEGCQSKAKFKFPCKDPLHWAAAGRSPQ